MSHQDEPNGDTYSSSKKNKIIMHLSNYIREIGLASEHFSPSLRWGVFIEWYQSIQIQHLD